jgi:hypothetical protein
MSDKKLQDYLHFYMGCKFITDNSEGEVNPETIRFIYPMIEKGYNVQLVLRKLEDWTAEELKTYNTLKGKKTDGVHAVYIAYDTPQTFNYLLKQGFDLFNLIDAGLAIDAKTMTQGV